VGLGEGRRREIAAAGEKSSRSKKLIFFEAMNVFRYIAW